MTIRDRLSHFVINAAMAALMFFGMMTCADASVKWMNFNGPMTPLFWLGTAGSALFMACFALGAVMALFGKTPK